MYKLQKVRAPNRGGWRINVKDEDDEDNEESGRRQMRGEHEGK